MVSRGLIAHGDYQDACPFGFSFHATMLGKAAADSHIWSHARDQRLVIVSKDADFSDRIMASTPPPWIVHLRFGNRRLRDFRELMERIWPDIERLLPEHKLICV